MKRYNLNHKLPHSQSIFSRTLLPAGWETFDRYSSHVRSLEWIENNPEDEFVWTSISQTVLAEILPYSTVAPPSRAPLSSDRRSASGLYKPLRTPLLKGLVIKLGSSYTEENRVQCVRDILPLLPAMTPSLQHLDILFLSRLSSQVFINRRATFTFVFGRVTRSSILAY
ncbi:hypothetical protein M422DRAFT_248220 [Sphaerobolus stellatus SS14]|uniref:Uncharacterized protein n=1 Tax=Sphaerobolus stellatus (strain SS14) TaxID=990650 RepID=A0A0C9W4Y4_SPHS4|nr:hypothetical protein M422DRAFT_248220 [Sphaerobolus stellatus SS14]